MKQRFLSVLVLIAMFLSFVLPLGSIVRAAVSVSVINIPAYIPIDCSTSTTTPGNGTPIAVYVKATGGAANTTYKIKSRVGPTTSALSYALWWANVSTTPYSWGTDTTAWASTWPITTDGSGNWSGWIVTKVNMSITNDTSFNWGNNIYYRASLREGSNNRQSTPLSITPLNMAISGSGTLGGWIEGIAYDTTGTPLQGYPVVVRNSSGTIIGIYFSENNNVNEGYSLTSGYYKVAAPVGSGYTVEVWDPATNSIIGNTTKNVWVKAGLTTPNVDINYGNTTVPPTVMQTNPTNGATNVPVNTTISVTFDRDMDPSTITTSTFTVKDASNNPIAGAVSYDVTSKTATFTPQSNLNYLTAYSVTISGSIKDLSSNSLGSDYVFSFTTRPSGPTVVSTNPTNSATNVPVNTTISVTFDRDMDASTITTSTFTVKDASNTSVSGTVSYEATSKTATFTPSNPLSSKTTYTVTISGAVADTSGNTMDVPYTFSFTTVELPITIAEARAKPIGTSVYISGNVTVVPGTFNKGFAIQDSTGGIYIYPSTQPTGIALGDVVEVKGTLKNYNNLLELDPVSYINRISSGTCPPPKELTLQEVNETNEGLLVKVTGTVTAYSKSTSGHVTITITDGTSQCQVYVYAQTGINTSNVLVGDSITVTGFLGQYSSNYQIQPRYQSDIILNKPQVVSTNPTNGTTNVPLTSNISIKFDRPLDTNTISNSITVKDSSNNPILGTITYDASTYTLTFTPQSNLPYDFITVTVSKDIKDTLGNPMGTDYVFEFATFVLQSASPTTPFTTSSDTSLKIFAIMYNSLEQTINQKGEAICLMNTGSATVNISNYVITDFEGSVQFPTNTYIAPNVKIWVAREAVEFANEFGFKPNFEYGRDSDPTVPNLININSSFPVFDNTSDECAVFDSSNNIVDVVAWGTSDYANTGWIGNKINPYIFASYISPYGDIAYRKLNEETNLPFPDTNTFSDWSWDPTDPLYGCKIMYPGWDTWELFPKTVKHSGTVTTTFALSPDNAFYALRDAIRSTTTSIKIELYTITSLEIMQEILNKMDQGVQVKALFDGEVYGATGGTYDQVRWFATQVVNKGGTVYFLRDTSPIYPHDRYNNVHIKTIIFDDSKVFISADNLTRSSMPCDDLSDGTAGNRGATLITNDPVIVQGVLNIFNHDFKVGYYDVSPYNPSTDAPPSGYIPPAMDNPSGYTPVQPNYLTVTEFEELELIQSPDTSIKATEGIIGLINKAGAGDIVIDENQYEYLYWGPSGNQYINPRLQALINAAQRGAQVYILLDSVNSSSTNTPTKNYLDSLNNPNIHVLLGNPTSGNGSYPIHNKMFLARIQGKGYVNISSINGSENASKANRELGLIVQSNAGFEYFYKAFVYDWQVSGGTIDSNPSTAYIITASAGLGGSITPSGTVTVNYGESKSFTIKADPGFMIFKVLVDNSPITISNYITMTYTFSNVTSNHTIRAEFMPIPDLTPPTVTLPTINGVDLNLPNASITTNANTLTFTVSATDESGILRMVVKVNGVVQIDKDNLDPTIYLTEGVNLVEVIVYDTKGNSTSKTFKVVKDSTPPTLTFTADIPQTTSNPTLTLKGMVYDNISGVKSLKVNGIAIPFTVDGNFETTFTLQQGVNTLTLIAEDQFNNTLTKTYTVNLQAQTQTKKTKIITLQVNSPYITIDFTTTKKIDTQGSKPIIKNGRTLIPIRTLIESLGGTVEWNEKEKKITITLNGHSVVIFIGKTNALVDGSSTTLDVAPQIINVRTYIPLRFVSENLGMVVDWDAKTQTITIYYIP